MKRSKGEGSVYKRKDGSWCAQYHDGNKRRYIYGKKKQVVTDRLRNALVALENGTVFDPEPMEVGEYLTYWLSSVDGTVRDRTLQRYKGLRGGKSGSSPTSSGPSAWKTRTRARGVRRRGDAVVGDFNAGSKVLRGDNHEVRSGDLRHRHSAGRGA